MKPSAGRLFVTLAVLVSGAGAAIVAQPVFDTSGLDDSPPREMVFPQESPCSFTQNSDFDFVPGGGLACTSAGIITDNQYLRIFDLDGEHEFVGEVCIDSLEYAVESSAGDVELTFNVYCVAQGLADAAINDGIDRDVDLDPGLVFTTSAVQPDAQFMYFNQPLGGCCDADNQDLAIEIATPDCLETGLCLNFFPGAADFASASKPYYIGAPDCGIVDPINADAITGLGVNPIVWQLHATCEGGPDVPATDPRGVVLLLIALGAAGVYAARRASRV